MNHFAPTLLALALVGCDDNIPSAVADAGCTGTLDEVANHPYAARPCAPTYDAALAQHACFGTSETLQAGPCGGRLYFVQNFSVHSFTCVYDATTRALVGAHGSEDAPAYCGGTASDIVGGVAPACALDPTDLNQSCASDAGP